VVEAILKETKEFETAMETNEFLKSEAALSYLKDCLIGRFSHGNLEELLKIEE